MEIKKPRLAIIVPCFNEEEVLNKTIKKLSLRLEILEKEERISENSFLFFIDDGSADKTSEILENAYKNNSEKIKYIKLCRNFGNQSAIFAGLKETKEKFNPDCAIIIDADLQQDEEKIGEFVDKMNEGFDVVAGVKKTRGKEPFYKTITALIYYKTMNFFGIKITKNHSEFRLLSKYAIDYLMQYKENNVFIRGVLAQSGLNTAYIEFEVNPRECGKSKFTFSKLLKLGFLGLISHTTKPLAIIFIVGLIVTLACFLVLSAAVILEFITPEGLKNVHFFEVWNTFLSGIQILCLGIMGQYLGQVLVEVKQRPKYLIKEERL